MITYITAFGIGIMSFVAFLQTPLLFLFRMLGYHYYIIRKDDEKTRALAKALQATTYNSVTLFHWGSFHPSGYFINWHCVGCYEHYHAFDNITLTIYIMTTPKYFQSIFQMENQVISFADKTTDEPTNEPSIVTCKTVTFFSRVGAYTNLYYSRFRIDVQGLEPKGQQLDVVNKICERFAEKHRGVYFISGVSGAGKSKIGLLIACRLNGALCHTFNPSDPGDTLQLILRDSEPTEERPTIILLDEVNMMIRGVHKETIPQHKNITTCVHNKNTYNTFMDDMILYRNVIIIMTSNEDKETIDKLDPCYLRKGRVDDYFSMMEVLPC